MRLTALLEGLSYRILAGPLDPEVCELVHNHQEVRPKAAFVAIQGARFDGHAFVPEAIQRGAGAVIVERPVEVPPEVTVVQLEDTRRALSLLAANRYGHPANSLVLVGVTGTNGKTSVTYLVQSLFARRGYACSRIGTIAYEIGGELLSAGTTTPDALELQRLLRRAVDRGSQAVVMEVSSHALVQHRVAALQFDVAVWTNLTQDHLDFHQTMEAYRDAKLLLFRRHLKPSGLAVLNRDDPLYPAFRTAAEEAGAQRITFGRDGSADVRAEAVELTPTETRFLLRWNDKAQPVRLRLLGIFSVWNALAAAAVGLGMGWELPEIVEAIESVPGVPGRFEPVHAGQPFGVVVDYAHTPDALKNSLKGPVPSDRSG
ncbi:MAG: hypothetical protein KatS3mg115_0544 [Candidatus Poribacteria bacterium]|nr:MAG: hypothetical protein KatS3mg115_0544 [Candidatus Poribacteria bacterium]